jgi:hypothetical protein
MPPLSTDITDDDSSILSELDSDQFTYSDASNKPSSSSIIDTLTPLKPYQKCKLTATFTWGLTYTSLLGEPSHDRKNKI